MAAAEFEAESRAAWRPPAALQMVQQATVMEASGRAVTAYGTSLLDAYPFYVGLEAGVGGRGARGRDAARGRGRSRARRFAGGGGQAAGADACRG